MHKREIARELLKVAKEFLESAPEEQSVQYFEDLLSGLKSMSVSISFIEPPHTASGALAAGQRYPRQRTSPEPPASPCPSPGSPRTMDWTYSSRLLPSTVKHCLSAQMLRFAGCLSSSS